MTKRAFIDIVRQYQAHTKRKGVSYAEPVRVAASLYYQRLVDSGMSQAELEKEQAWMEAFLNREYGKYDGSWSMTGTG